MTIPTPGISVSLRLSNQWNGAFDGEITITNQGSTALSDWSVSFCSRYPLRNVSNFSVQQSQNADGTWQITLGPPSWGMTLAPKASSSSYLQGSLPVGGSLSNLQASDVLIGAASGSGSTPGTSGGGTRTTGTTGGSSGTGTTTGTAAPGGTTGSTGSSGTGSTGGAGITGGTPLSPGGINSGNSGDRLWGEQFFAPYVDMTLYPVPDLDGLARQHGVGLFTLAFLQATPTGEAAWAGLPALSLTSTNPQALAIRTEINQLRAAGGDVMVSMGGANGISLAQSFYAAGRSATELATRYGQVIDSLALNRLDFDIEGAALADRGANQLHSAALKLVQQSHPDLEIWITLPVLPQGLTNDGLTVLRQMLDAGVKLDGVNLMAMDYGDSAAPPASQSMGQYAIDAAHASYRQLSELFGSHGESFGWNQLGLTPMIGVNDVTSELFSTGDAALVEDFARQKGLGMLSMWSLGRDQPGPIGRVEATHSGTAAGSGAYAAIWGDYGTDPVISGGSGAGGSSGGGSGVNSGGLTGLPTSNVAVGDSITAISASDSKAERFQLGYAWGRHLTIQGFNPGQDVLDLGGFWTEGQQAQVVAGSSGCRVVLGFNAQEVLLPGVDASALTSSVLAVWQG